MDAEIECRYCGTCRGCVNVIALLGCPNSAPGPAKTNAKLDPCGIHPRIKRMEERSSNGSGEDSRYVFRRFGLRVAGNVRSGSEEHSVKLFGWIHLAFGLLAAGAGVIVLRGVFQRTLSSASTVRFLRWSLIASLAGLLPLSRHLAPVQQICILSVYWSAAAIVAWLKFGLVGRSRWIFALSVTGILYFDLVFVATRLFRNPPLFTAPLANPLPFFQFVQILFAAAFIVLGILAVSKCRIEPAGMPASAKFRHIH